MAVVAMSSLTAVAIAGNLAVLVAVLRSPSLRRQLTSFFVASPNARRGEVCCR